MKIKKVLVSKSIKMSHDYNSVEETFGVEVEIKEDDNPNEVINKVQEFVADRVRYEMSKTMKKLVTRKLLEK